MTSPAALDIIVVNYNTREVLAACLQSLHHAPPQRLHTVVVVDNASTDDSAAMVRARFPQVRLEALGRNIGFGAANNHAIRSTTAPLVLLLNSDTIAPAGAIDGLIARLEAMGATAAGPRLVDRRGLAEVSFGRMLSPWAEFAQGIRVALAARDAAWSRSYIRGLTSRERFVDWVSGACLLVRRNAFEAAGLFDERYFMYEEDVDACAALRAGGGRILFTPLAEIVHLRGASVGPAARTGPTAYDRSHLAFYAKHHPRWVPLLRWWKRMRGRA
jgi:N-acetylglucosaminyl-diphospho-decaprenol L-rhamnosyltransferase